MGVWVDVGFVCVCVCMCVCVCLCMRKGGLVGGCNHSCKANSWSCVGKEDQLGQGGEEKGGAGVKGGARGWRSWPLGSNKQTSQRSTSSNDKDQLREPVGLEDEQRREVSRHSSFIFISVHLFFKPCYCASIRNVFTKQGKAVKYLPLCCFFYTENSRKDIQGELSEWLSKWGQVTHKILITPCICVFI